MSFPFPRPFTGPAYFGDSSSVALLLGNSETAGLAIDFTASSNRLLIRNNNLPLYKGNAFNNDGGPVSFSRASLGTVVDSDGKVKWAAHNLLTNSEQFDSSNWAKSSTTVTANTVAAPNGTTTAETVAASGANGTLLQTYTAVAGQYTFGIWLRRKTGTGNIDIAADSGTWTTRTITADWAFYTVNQTPAAGSKTAGLRIVTSGDEVYAWGATLYRSDLGGMQANMSAYPMYNPTTAKNLLGFTEAFSDAYWTKGGSSIDADLISAPNGLRTADYLKEDFANSQHRTFMASTSPIISGTRYTQSVYAKAANRSQLFMRVAGANSDTNGALFDLSAQTATPVGTIVSASITSVGDGWFRCTLISDATSIAMRFYIALSSSGNLTYQGDGTSGLYIWGAQLSDSASLDPYVPNHFAAPSAAAYHGPRIDYDPATLAPRGLLVEEQRTNLLVRSAEFDNAAWVKSNATVTANAAAAPDGTNTADKIIETSAVNRGRVTQSTTAVVGQTLSVYAKAAEWNRVCLGITNGSGQWAVYNFNLSNGTYGNQIVYSTPRVGSPTITDVGNGWYRCSVTVTTASTEYPVIMPFNQDGDPVNPSPALNGDGVSGIYIWGAQLEAGSFATSYIPTTSASVTRSADVAQIGTAAFPYNATEGTIIASYDVTAFLANQRVFALNDATAANEAGLYTSTGSHRMIVTTASVNEATPIGLVGVSANTVYKSALAFKTDDFAISTNGNTAVTDTLGAFSSSMTRLNLGSNYNSANLLNGHIRQLTYIPRRISNAELQARTA